MATQTTSRRQRVRHATLLEIRVTARRLLIDRGSAAVSINAVAREMGMRGPALYRYYPSHEKLVEAVTGDFYNELTQTMQEARDAHESDTHSRRLLATVRSMRTWAVAHPAEFGWMFASSIPLPSTRVRDFAQHQAGIEFGEVFLDQIVQLWNTRPFPVPAMEDLDPSLSGQMRDYAAEIGGRLPPEAVHVYLTCWIRLYGLLSMEILGQLDFAYSDLTPVFEERLRELCAAFGCEYELPADV